ncbi:MAG: hypothetical protein AAB372_01115 [Patescibacteria group bacterium]
MAKRAGGIKMHKKSKRSPKTKKRLEIKRAMLETKKGKKHR